MKKGNIIILNGVSSSGKTTLAGALQNTFTETYVRLSLDDFQAMLPAKVIEKDFDASVCQAQTLLLQTVKALSDGAVNVVVDNVMLSCFQTFKEYVAVLHEYPVLLVRVDCPLSELRRRELERGDRMIGLSEHQLKILDPRDAYDLTVNTFDYTVAECVSAIGNEIKAARSISALKQCWLASSQGKRERG